MSDLTITTPVRDELTVVGGLRADLVVVANNARTDVEVVGTWESVLLFEYYRPGGVDQYLRPDGVSKYKRAA